MRPHLSFCTKRLHTYFCRILWSDALHLVLSDRKITLEVPLKNFLSEFNSDQFEKKETYDMFFIMRYVLWTNVPLFLILITHHSDSYMLFFS